MKLPRSPKTLRRATLGATLWLAMASTAAVAAPAAPATPAATLRSGEQVVQAVCSACHDSGVAHAPKRKDAAAWKPLIEEGQAVLTGHAWVGVRAMPAKGGAQDLKLEEFARAVAFMAREAGADWRDPDPTLLRRIAHEADGRLTRTIRESQAMQRELRRLSRPR